jgi:hypothetical protein
MPITNMPQQAGRTPMAPTAIPNNRMGSKPTMSNLNNSQFGRPAVPASNQRPMNSISRGSMSRMGG